MWKFILAVPMFAHGLAHLSGFLASWISLGAGYTGRPWLFSQAVTLQSWAGRAFSLLWLVAMTGFIGSAFGMLLGQAWWPLLMVVSSAVSMVVIVPWWHTVPPGAKVGAFFDIVILSCLLTPLQRQLLDIVR